MKTSKEFAALGLTVNEVIKGLNKYFDGPSIDNVRFYSAKMDYTCNYSPKCCLAVAILWLHEQGIEYFYGMPLPCEEEQEQEIQVKVRNVLSADISIEPDSLPELEEKLRKTVKMALWDGSFDNVLVDSVCEELIRYISKWCTELEDRVEKLTEKYNTLRTGLITVLGVNPGITDRQLLCKVSRLYYFRREVQRKLDCPNYSDENTMAVLLKIIDKAKCFDDMDKQYMETTKSLCEIAAIIERLQSTDEKKDV
jgi:DNA repair exonuclease SbcCD ATPase subunit